MISFPCHCGHRFKLMDEMAGGLIQCPKCDKLNDVPTLSDLVNIEGDGTFKIGDAPKEPEKNRLSSLIRTYAHGTYDDEGNEIDLRNDAVQMSKAGANETAPEYRNRARHNQPKYDPETGELVLPLNVATDDQPAVMAIPIGSGSSSTSSGPAGGNVLGYARQNPNSASQQPLPIGLVLIFRPLNLLVLGIVLIMHIFVLGGLIFCAMLGPLMILFAPMVISIILLIPAHYGCVVEDFGIDHRDELPRPLRSVEFWDDLFYPGMRVLVALICAYGPAVFTLVATNLPDPVRVGLFAILGLLGCVLFPSIMLTAVTSGAYVNLRPDRVMSIIWKCGPRYWLAVVFMALASLVYLLTICVAAAPIVALLLPIPVLWAGYSSLVVLGLALVAIFLTHLGSMELGFLYRKYHESFPWAFQRHIPVNVGKRTHTGPRAGVRATSAPPR